GLGEVPADIVEMAFTLRDLKVDSIPVNFFIPIEGARLKNKPDLSPESCLRILCLFRLLNPKADIRISAGREIYLRNMETLAFYPATSLFIDGYLNAKGDRSLKTLCSLNDAGFTVKSDFPLEELIEKEFAQIKIEDNNTTKEIRLKKETDLRPMAGLKLWKI
ncbi:MAG: biotin synthase BioB, partial [Candidatus Omnitrophica bacterium]|nr:biotin synthase BioB [Candidatus Omnitrophota bacterium]